MTDHPLRTAADTADSNVTSGGMTETMLAATIVRSALSLGATEELGDYSFDVGAIPLAVIYGKTGYVYFYNADDTTTADDGLTCLVSGDGRRYQLADMSAIAIASVLAIENTPPGSPTVGDAYVVDTSPTGAWASHAKDVALYTVRGWVFATPKVGQALLVEDIEANYQYDVSGAWGPLTASFGGNGVTPADMQFPGGLSVEAQQNAPPVSITAGLHYLVGTAGSGAWSGHSNDIAYSVDGSTWLFIDAYDGMQVFNKSSDAQLTWFDATGTWRPVIAIQDKCQGRLTLESGVAISTTDQTAKGTLYFTPYNGNIIALYSNGSWSERVFTEVSLSLSGYTTAKPYDIFGYDNAGTLALESLVWTNDTTRATALTTQDGILVKTGDATRRYLGTIYTSATSQCEDSLAKRLVWNEYNSVIRPMLVKDTTNTWSAAGGTLRQARASTANQLEFVIGRNRNLVEADVIASGRATGSGPTSGTGTIAIGLDSTTTKATDSLASTGGAASVDASTIACQLAAKYCGYPGPGRHRLMWLERDTGTWEWVGDDGTSTVQSGISGKVLA